MLPRLNNFLVKHKEKNGIFTNISMMDPLKGKFNIQKEDTEEFWKLYCDCLQKNELVAGIGEKPEKYSPVLCDADIKIKYDENIHKNIKELYTQEQLKIIIKIYQKYLKEIIHKYEPKHGICLVFEKEHPFRDNNGNIKHGFHLQFINTLINKIDNDVHLIPRVKQHVENMALFSEIGVSNSGNVIDNVSGKNWLLYGSRKEKHLQAYKLTKIYNDDLREITLEDAIRDYVLYDSNRDIITLDTNEKIKYNLPRILSIHPCYRDIVAIKNNLNIIGKDALVKSETIIEKFKNMTITETLLKAEKLLNIISDKRADEYNDWIEIGWTLFNIGKGSEEAYNLWVKFSERTTKKGFSEKSCFSLWSGMKVREDGKGIGSLYRYASEDNKEKYREFIRSEQKKNIADSIEMPNHADIAAALAKKYDNKFICVGVKERNWYRYENHRWVRDYEGIHIRSKIDDILNEYTNLIKEYYEENEGEIDYNVSGVSDLQEKVDIINKAKKDRLTQVKLIKNAQKWLKTTGNRDNVIKELGSLVEMYDYKFEDKLDKNPYLIHFTNGILDLKQKRLRPGEPTDYVSLTTGYDFEEFKDDDIDLIECKAHFEKVFPDKSLLEYFYQFCGTLLEGKNKRKTFEVWSGFGHNAKSINLEILKQTLGDYMKSLPTSILINKRTQSSGCTPETSSLNGVRLVIVQETSGDDRINDGVLKEFTGNDTMYSRGLFKEGKNFTPFFKFLLICNLLPKLENNDPAIWARVRVLFHESRFSTDEKIVPNTVEEQFKKKIFPCDLSFNEKIPLMIKPFMWIIWNKYLDTQRNGFMKEPVKVVEATSNYKKINDFYLQFCDEKIIKVCKVDGCKHEKNKCNHKNSVLLLNEVYQVFKGWYDDTYPSSRHNIPPKETAKGEFINKLGTLITPSNKWYGYRLRTKEDDDEDIKNGDLVILGEDDLVTGSEDESD